MLDMAGPMIGKTCVVTGANAGIGKATALGLARMGATVVMVCRSPERGEAALAEIKRASGNDSVSVLLADLSSQAAIRRLVVDYKSQFPNLHVLINNAGIVPQKRTVTEDGLEMQFAVNHLAYFLLTDLLLDVLRSSAPARIVNVTSAAHRGASIDVDDLQYRRSYDHRRVYAGTKLCNVLFTYELARRLQGTGVTANCLHPGVVSTNLLRNTRGTPGAPRLSKDRTPEEGARTPLYLATSAEVEGVTGKYFDDRISVASSSASYDEAAASRLWQLSAELTAGSSAYSTPHR